MRWHATLFTETGLKLQEPFHGGQACGYRIVLDVF
jgi:hypothetical protein